MNCANWEERIALYMGGDLAPEEAAQVKQHLADCAGCQVFAGGMRESLELLREQHQDEIAPAVYAAVRARVLGELGRRPARRWIFGLAAALGAAALLAAVWMRPAKPVIVARHDRPVSIAHPVIPVPPAAVPIVRVHRRHIRPRPRQPLPVVKAALPQKPLVVKMVTDDPDVVIYWITDTRGE